VALDVKDFHVTLPDDGVAQNFPNVDGFPMFRWTPVNFRDDALERVKIRLVCHFSCQ
jgi:hypothetical protein